MNSDNNWNEMVSDFFLITPPHENVPNLKLQWQPWKTLSIRPGEAMPRLLKPWKAQDNYCELVVISSTAKEN
jgi:hypothetical protein